jgi:hypothetical protein
VVDDLRRKLLMISVDGLVPTVLGPYGSAWATTPCLNQFAVGAIVFDQFWADSGDPLQVIRSMLTGTHAQQQLRRMAGREATVAVSGCMRDAIVMADGPFAAFQQVDGVELLAVPLDDSPDPSADLESTHLAGWTANGLRCLTDHSETDLLWFHTSSLLHRWDAPLQWREALADDETLVPWDRVTPPQQAFGDADPPDELLRCIHAYAAQVQVLDACIGVLARAAEDRTLVITGTSGMAMGEHGWIGPGGAPLLSPRLHLPLLISDPTNASTRCGRMVQPPDLTPTLQHVCGEDPESFADERRWGRSLWPHLTPENWAIDDEPTDQVYGAEEGHTVWACRGWLYATHNHQEQLFLRPDDRFCVNDGWDRLPQLHAAVRQAREHFEAALAADDRERVVPLTEELRERV